MVIFSQVNTPDKNLQLIQSNIQSALSGLQASNVTTVTYPNGTTAPPKITQAPGTAPFSNGNVIAIPLTSGQDNLVPHGLGRVPSYWVIVRLNANTTIWEMATASLPSPAGTKQSATSQFLNLWCSASCQASVWVA